MLAAMEPLRSIDLRRIRHFVTLAETLNFSRAAERLHMAQPPLSISIRKLETELGITLFTRDARGVALTPSGRAVLPEARRILFHAAQFIDLARNTANGTGGSLRIGFVGSTTYGMLQRLVARFRAEHPGVELVLTEATSTHILQLLEDDELDVGLVRTPLSRSSSAALVELERDEFVAALPRGTALSNKGPLRLAELANENFIMYAASEATGLRNATMAICQEAGFLPRVTQEAIQIQTVLSLVESGLGVALVPSVMQRYGSERIAYRPLLDAVQSARIGLALAYRPAAESAAAQRFRAVATLAFQTFPTGSAAA